MKVRMDANLARCKEIGERTFDANSPGSTEALLSWNMDGGGGPPRRFTEGEENRRLLFGETEAGAEGGGERGGFGDVQTAILAPPRLPSGDHLCMMNFRPSRLRKKMKCGGEREKIRKQKNTFEGELCSSGTIPTLRQLAVTSTHQIGKVAVQLHNLQYFFQLLYFFYSIRKRHKF
jgi:hypothetical protein